MFDFLRASRILLLVVLCTAVSASQYLQADELSAEEIMAMSDAAMKQPLSYTSISAKGVETVVYQKTLQNGAAAKLTERTETKTITIAYDKKSYEIHLEHQLAIDMAHIWNRITTLESNPLFAGLENISPKKTLELTGSIRYDGRDCYEILEKIAPELQKALLDRLPEDVQGRFPVMDRMIIDKESYLVQVRERQTAEGTVVSKREYRDIHVQPDLSDDFFQLPPGLEIVKPASSKEYLAVMADRLVPKRPPADTKAITEKLKEESDRRVQKIENELEEKFKQKEAEAVRSTEEILSEARSNMRGSENFPLQKTPSHRWVVVISVNVIVIALLIVLWRMRRKTRK